MKKICDTRDKIYDAIYRLFFKCDYRFSITVEGIEMRLYNPLYNDIEDNIWNMGIIANGTVYQIGALYMEGKGPGTYGELFRGDYDIIGELTECIYNEKLSKE